MCTSERKSVRWTIVLTKDFNRKFNGYTKRQESILCQVNDYFILHSLLLTLNSATGAPSILLPKDKISTWESN